MYLQNRSSLHSDLKYMLRACHLPKIFYFYSLIYSTYSPYFSTLWQLCQATTANNSRSSIFFYHLWTDPISIYLPLPLNHIQIQWIVLNATKHKPSRCIFLKSRPSYPHAMLFPRETLGLSDSVPSLSFTFKVAADRPECKVDGGGLHSLWALINGDSEGFWGLAVTQG